MKKELVDSLVSFYYDNITTQTIDFWNIPRELKGATLKLEHKPSSANSNYRMLKIHHTDWMAIVQEIEDNDSVYYDTLFKPYVREAEVSFFDWIKSIQ